MDDEQREFGTITVSRMRDEDVKYRQVVVRLDDEDRWPDLLYGQEQSRPIAAGSHVLRVHNTLFWKKVPFEVKPGEHVRFSVVNYSKKSFWLWMGLAGIAILYLKVERDSA